MSAYLTLEAFLDNQDFYISEAQAGKIFVYPTDTIYGIWAIYNKENKNRIFQIKHRDEKKMFSIMAPSFDWIKTTYPEANIDELKKYLSSYHGVTYIFSYETPGVRIIKHPFQNFVQTLNDAFITTSCNIAGEPIVTDVQNLPADIAQQVDYIIDGWILGGRPSVLIDLVANKIIER